MKRAVQNRKARHRPSFPILSEIHPLIRVVSLLLFSAGTSLARPALLIAGLVLLAVIYLANGFPAMGKLLAMLNRLRWLMLAILLVYGWWTPGEHLFPASPTLSPTVEGLQLGAIRMLVLVIIVAAVHLLLQRTAREQLLAALMQLFTPFLSRKSRERLAVRIVLSMEAVSRIQPLLHGTLSGRSLVSRNLSAAGIAAADIYTAVLDTAGQADCDSISITEAAQPALWQWLIPLLLGTGIFLLF